MVNHAGEDIDTAVRPRFRSLVVLLGFSWSSGVLYNISFLARRLYIEQLDLGE